MVDAAQQGRATILRKVPCLNHMCLYRLARSAWSPVVDKVLYAYLQAVLPVAHGLRTCAQLEVVASVLLERSSGNFHACSPFIK